MSVLDAVPEWHGFECAAFAEWAGETKCVTDGEAVGIPGWCLCGSDADLAIRPTEDFEVIAVDQVVLGDFERECSAGHCAYRARL